MTHARIPEVQQRCSPTCSQEKLTPLGGGLVGLCEVRPSRSHKLYKSVDSERIFYPSDDSLLPGPWSTGTEGGRAPGRGGAVLASPVPNNSDIDIFVGGTPANETIASLFSRDASWAGGLWDLSDALGLVLARLPGDVLLAGLMAVYTKNGIFASLFILHSVSAAPKPWYYALYVPGSGWGVFSTWDLCAAHGAIGGSRARHKKYRNIQEALDHINVHYPIPTSTQILLGTRLLVPV